MAEPRDEIARKVATRIAGFHKADHDEGCEPMMALTAAEWSVVLAALRSPGLDRDGERMREACIEACEAKAEGYRRHSPECAEAINALSMLAHDLRTHVRALAHEEKAGC